MKKGKKKKTFTFLILFVALFFKNKTEQKNNPSLDVRF